MEFESNPANKNKSDLQSYVEKYARQELKTTNTLVAITHGSAIRNLFSTSHLHINNTSTFESTFNLSGERLELHIVPIYEAPLLRSEYKNFEALNNDICRTESVKGVINYPLWEASHDRGMIPFTSSLYSSWFQTRDFVDDDVKFVFTETPGNTWFGVANASENNICYYDPEMVTKRVITGGSNYYNKYLKYKKKYLSMKNKMIF
jgi:hypothetical protein